MRVLHMIPDIGIANGVMSAVLNFAKAMPEDIVFDVVYFHETEMTRKSDIEELGGKVYKIRKPSPGQIKSKELTKFFNEHKGEWSALHIHAPHFAVFIAPYAKKAGIKKICVHCHSTDYSLKGNSKRNELLSLYSKYFVKDKFACSKLAGKFWYGNKPFTVINNAIDCRKFAFSEEARQQKRKELGITDEKVFSHIGRTDIPQKNHTFLLSVFAQIKKSQKSKLLLIGAEPTDELEKLCRENEMIEDVLFLGMRSDISELLSASDVFLFPSTKEGLPVSLIEAQASGLPVLMSDSVTDEVCVTDSVSKLSLNEDISLWSDKAISLISAGRYDTFDKLFSSRWDISKLTDILSSYYGGNND